MFRRKICVVVGGANGKGRSIVEEYAGQKYRVVFMDIDGKSGSSLKEKIERESGGKVFFFNGDVNSEEDRELFAGLVGARYRKIDCLYYRSDIMGQKDSAGNGGSRKNGENVENGNGKNGIEGLLWGYLAKDGIVRDFSA